MTSTASECFLSFSRTFRSFDSLVLFAYAMVDSCSIASYDQKKPKTHSAVCWKGESVEVDDDGDIVESMLRCCFLLLSSSRPGVSFRRRL